MTTSNVTPVRSGDPVCPACQHAGSISSHELVWTRWSVAIDDECLEFGPTPAFGDVEDSYLECGHCGATHLREEDIVAASNDA